MAPVAIAFAVLELTGSATDLGLVLAAHGLALSGRLAAGVGVSTTLWAVGAAICVSQTAVLFVPSLRRLEFRPGATGPPPPPRPIEAGD
jgi:hypothetical protein